MTASAIGVIFSNMHEETVPELVRRRTMASIPFGGRYRIIDFTLSNMVNSGINTVGLVTSNNYRSLIDHIGSGKDWDLARRKDSINIISPYQTATNAGAKVFATHLEALINMKQYIDEFKEEHVILLDSDTVLNIDIADVVSYHEKTGADITMVTRIPEQGYTCKHPRMFVSQDSGKIDDLVMATAATEKNPEMALDIFVMKTVYLRSLIDEAIAYGFGSFTTMLFAKYKQANYRTYCYEGYAACVSSFLDYYRYSIALATDPASRASLLGVRERPIFTRVHNSAPVVYSTGASVKNSLIADDCIIEGTVENSVISRGVRIGKGAVVKNSIVFQGSVIEKNATLNCIVTDKNVIVTEGTVLSGSENMPFFVQKGRKV